MVAPVTVDIYIYTTSSLGVYIIIASLYYIYIYLYLYIYISTYTLACKEGLLFIGLDAWMMGWPTNSRTYRYWVYPPKNEKTYPTKQDGSWENHHRLKHVGGWKGRILVIRWSFPGGFGLSQQVAVYPNKLLFNRYLGNLKGSFPPALLGVVTPNGGEKEWNLDPKMAEKIQVKDL